MSERDFSIISGFPDYAVKKDGSVWSRRPRNGKGPALVAYRQLKPCPGEYGHLFVHLHHEGRRVIRRVHRLILEAFIGLCPAGMECRHLDGNPANNSVTNLAWGTHQENEADKLLHGTRNRGERQGHSKLTKTDVLQIRRALADGAHRRATARRFGVSFGTIYDIEHRKTWAWLDETFPDEPARAEVEPSAAARRGERDVWLERTGVFFDADAEEGE